METAGLYWEAHGPAGSRPVILSSGLGGSATYWTPNLAALAANHRVILYDHRGTGRSDRRVDGDLTIEAMADDLALLIDAAGLASATIVGHAIGGMAGLALAIRRPDLVERLAVINGWGWLDPHTARCFDTRLALLRGSGVRPFLHAQPLFLYPPVWISEHDAQLRDEEEVHLTHFSGPEMMTRRIAAARRFAPGEALRTIAAPVLLVASDDDMLVPPTASERLHAAMPTSQLAKLSNGGHACNVTRADHFNMWLIDWLDGE